MGAKTPTQHMFDELIDAVMLYLHEANCFGEEGMNDKRYQEVFDFYKGEVRAAIGTVFNPSLDIVVVYTIGDVNDRLDSIYGEGGWSFDDWPLDRRMRMLSEVVQSRTLNETFEYLLSQEIEPMQW